LCLSARGLGRAFLYLSIIYRLFGWFVQPLSSVGEAVFSKRLASLARIGGQRNG
jgi:hypothetical protein